MMQPLRPSTLRDRARARYREYEAILFLTSGITVETRAQLDATYHSIPRISRASLQRFVSSLDREIRALRKEWGIHARRPALLELLEQGEKPPTDGSVLLVSKAWIESLCTNYSRGMPAFPWLPPHALVGLARLGKLPADAYTVEVWILEAIAFEDMAALVNEVRHRAGSIRESSGKVDRKTTSALLRAVLVSTFRFLEAYLNGLAFDALATGVPLTQGERDLLQEYDSKRGRSQFVGLRDKLLLYPRLAAGKKHPVLQENNSPDLAFMVAQAKAHRDAVVHASPLLLQPNQDTERFERAVNISVSEVEVIVDTAISLVRAIEYAVKGNDLSIRWLVPRGADGLFAVSVFD